LKFGLHLVALIYLWAGPYSVRWGVARRSEDWNQRATCGFWRAIWRETNGE